jgi:hypothetical protein
VLRAFSPYRGWKLLASLGVLAGKALELEVT